MATLQRIDLDDVIAHFNQLEDPRSPINRQHPLVSVVVIAVMAILAGAAGPTAIARWAKYQQAFLLPRLPLPAGIPAPELHIPLLLTQRTYFPIA